jgi:hypothetical protein
MPVSTIPITRDEYVAAAERNSGSMAGRQRFSLGLRHSNMVFPDQQMVVGGSHINPTVTNLLSVLDCSGFKGASAV